MTDISPTASRRSSRDDSLDGLDASDPAPAAPPPRPKPLDEAARADRAYEAALEKLDLPAKIKLEAAAPANRRDALVRARLDAFKERMEGPYRAEGLTVAAPAHFRMTGGANTVFSPAHTATFRADDPRRKDRDKYVSGKDELLHVAQQAKIPDATLVPVRMGRGTPEQLRVVTQALIDARRFPPGTPDNLSLRIHQMQWDHGIGVDCLGYTYQAFLATRGEAAYGAYGLKRIDLEDFTSLATNGHFRRVAVTEICAGDIVTLTPGGAENVGHNVIVYSHSTLAAVLAKRPDLAAAAGPPGAPEHEQIQAALANATAVHVLEVDSSWGAAFGDVEGGVRRDTWLFVEPRTWIYKDMHTQPHPWRVSHHGPSGSDGYRGAFRPVGEP